MKYLVTGSAGFIGTNLVDLLIDNNEEIVGVDNFSDYYSRKVKEHHLSQVKKSDKFIFIEADITDEVAMKKVFEEHKPEVVVNIAAEAGVTQSFDNPRKYFSNNTQGVVNLLEFCREYGCKKFIQASTSSEYGENPIPWTEDMDRDKPPHPYAGSKRCAEIIGYTYSKQYGIDFCALVFFNVYGPRQRPEMALSMLFKSAGHSIPFPLYQDPDETSRDYTYITDICEGIYLASKTSLGYEVINLGSSRPVKLGQFIKEVEKVTGKQIILDRKPNRQGEATLTYADCSKAKRLLNWKPKYTVKDGIKEFAKWFEEQPDWYKKIGLE